MGGFQVPICRGLAAPGSGAAAGESHAVGALVHFGLTGAYAWTVKVELYVGVIGQ